MKVFSHQIYNQATLK